MARIVGNNARGKQCDGEMLLGSTKVTYSSDNLFFVDEQSSPKSNRCRLDIFLSALIHTIALAANATILCSLAKPLNTGKMAAGSSYLISITLRKMIPNTTICRKPSEQGAEDGSHRYSVPHMVQPVTAAPTDTMQRIREDTGGLRVG